VCRKGPLDTLIIFTTTISVNNMYSTNIVVIVPIIWLYMTVVVVVISFSIIVSCIFISLLLVTVGIVYSRMGSNINVIIICPACMASRPQGLESSSKLMSRKRKCESVTWNEFAEARTLERDIVSTVV